MNWIELQCRYWNHELSVTHYLISANLSDWNQSQGIMLLKQFNQELIHCSNIFSFFLNLQPIHQTYHFYLSILENYMTEQIFKGITWWRDFFLINFSGNVFTESMASITVES